MYGCVGVVCRVCLGVCRVCFGCVEVDVDVWVCGGSLEIVLWVCRGNVDVVRMIHV